MTLKLIKHERVWLKQLPEFSEAWLHDQIKDDPSILGLGELELLDRERKQYGAGRLDLLLADSEEEIRYEVEIMLGAMDPSHIIRCIEYWDIERRRYPAYDHVAVLIAEDVTSRFLNVMSLLSGSIPLVAIQLNALRIADQIVLAFAKVLDQRALREDETLELVGESADRSTWERRVGIEMMKVCDRVAELANEVAEQKLEIKYQKRHLGICPHGSFFNVAALFPRKSLLAVRLTLNESDGWVKKLEEGGVEVKSKKAGRITLRIRPEELKEHEALIRELIHQAVQEF